jgi:hypothetical protein
MYIYNVTIKIDKTIRTEWLQWMTNEHLPEVLQTGMFMSYKLVELLEPVDEEGYTFSAQYHCVSLQSYEQYIKEFAPLLRERGFQLFGNKFIAFRSLLQTIIES